MEYKIVNFFPEIAGAFSGVISYDPSNWSSKTQMQAGYKNKLLLLDNRLRMFPRLRT